MPTQSMLNVMVMLSLWLSGCVIVMPPDYGDEDGNTTTSAEETTDSTDSGDSTGDESDGVLPDLPSDETTEDTTDESTDESTETTGGEASLCCTCPDAGSDEFECWDWSDETAESCLVAQSMALGEPTVWCGTEDGEPTSCLAQC